MFQVKYFLYTTFWRKHENEDEKSTFHKGEKTTFHKGEKTTFHKGIIGRNVNVNVFGVFAFRLNEIVFPFFKSLS